MKLLNGKEISIEIYTKLKKDIIELKEKDITPGLAVILVGERKDSNTYVNMKHKKCIELGIKSEIIKYTTEEVSNTKLSKKIEELNNDNSIHGILIQLPLPEHIDTELVFFCISKEVIIIRLRRLLIL